MRDARQRAFPDIPHPFRYPSTDTFR